jgi:hypothetical protein
VARHSGGIFLAEKKMANAVAAALAIFLFSAESSTHAA